MGFISFDKTTEMYRPKSNGLRTLGKSELRLVKKSTEFRKLLTPTGIHTTIRVC